MCIYIYMLHYSSPTSLELGFLMSPLSFHVLTGIDWEKTNLPSFFQIHILIYTYDNMSAGAGGSIRPSRRGDGTQLLGIIGDEVRNNVYDTRRTAQARERERE